MSTHARAADGTSGKESDPLRVWLRAERDFAHAAEFASHYITDVYDTGNSDTLNLYDVS